MRQSAVTYVLAGTTLFLSGVIVGGQARPDNLSKYERAYNFEALDMGVIQANLELLRWYVTTQSPEEPLLMRVPTIYFDQKTRKLRAFALVDAAMADKMSGEDLKVNLRKSVLACWEAVQPAFPTLPESANGFPGPDFYMEFRNGSLTKDEWATGKRTGTLPPSLHALFAEFKNGQLILHDVR